MGKPKLENMDSSDQAILDKAKATIEIGGKTYEWTEVGRRQARAMLCEMLPIINAFQKTEGEPATLMQLLIDCLDFFYRWHGRMKVDKAILDDKATNEEITAAFRAVLAVIDAPFLRDQAEARAAAEKVALPIPMRSPESSS